MPFFGTLTAISLIFVVPQLTVAATHDCMPTVNSLKGCPQLPVVAHGQITVANSLPNGDVVAKVHCHVGYNLVGPGSITCNRTDMRWSGLPGMCIYGGNKVNFDNLTIAIEKDDPAIVADILKHGSLINAQNASGWSALHMAAAYNSLKSAAYLLNNSADIHILNTRWQQPIHVAAHYDHVKIAEMLLERGPTSAIVEANDELTGRTPIFYAGNKPNLVVAKFLHTKGANLYHCDRYLMQPIHSAVAKKQTPFAKFLLGLDQEWANSRCCGWARKPLSHIAVEFDYADFVDEFPELFNSAVADGDGNTPLCRIAINDSVNFARKLSDKVKLNSVICPYQNGRMTGSLLHLAAYHKRGKVIAWLLETGTDVMTRDSQGRTALHILIAYNGSDEAQEVHDIINLLANHNTDIVDAVDNQHRTPFLTAVIVNSQPIADILLHQHAASPNIVDGKGWSPFHHVKTQRFLTYLYASIPNSLVEINRKSGSCTNENDENCLKNGSLTALHVAVMEAKPLEMIRYMLKFKADPNEVNDFGQSAIHLAVEFGYIEAANSLLKARDIHLELQDRHGRTALMVAIEKGDYPFVALLLNSSNTNSTILLNKGGQSVVHMAIRRNFTDAVKLFVHAKHTSVGNMRDSNGRTPLLYAMEIGNGHASEILSSVSNGINEQTLHSLDTPLHIAVRQNRINVAELLLESGADTSLKNAEGNDVLQEALISQHLDMVKLLFTSSNPNALSSLSTFKRNILHSVVKSGDGATEIARWLLWQMNNETLRSLLSSRDALDETPLHRAVTHENVEIVKLFLQHESPCNLRDKRGFTPVELAQHLGYKYLQTEMIKFPQCNKQQQFSVNTSCSNLIMNCPRPPFVENGIVALIQPDSACSGSKVTTNFTCSEGYKLTGTNVLSCDQDGNWSIDGHCKKTCSGAVNLRNANVTLPKTEATIMCNHGYYFDGFCEPICTHSGSWMVNGTCKKMGDLQVEGCTTQWQIIDAGCSPSSRSGYFDFNPKGEYYLALASEKCILIKAPINKKIRLQFVRWGGMSGYENVHIYDGHKSSHAEIGRFTGCQMPSGTVISSGANNGFAFVHYKRNPNVGSRGSFNLKWEILF